MTAQGVRRNIRRVWKTHYTTSSALITITIKMYDPNSYLYFLNVTFRCKTVYYYHRSIGILYKRPVSYLRLSIHIHVRARALGI